MNWRTLILRSLRFHWRGHLGALLGAAIGSAALIGALVVGDSVRGSLRDLALQRLGNIRFAMDTGDRFFRAQLAKIGSGDDVRFWWPVSLNAGKANGSGSQSMAFSPNGIFIVTTVSNQVLKASYSSSNVLSGALAVRLPLQAVLKLTATAATPTGDARASRVQLLGVDTNFGQFAATTAFQSLPSDGVILNAALAEQLHVSVGDLIVLRAHKPEALGADSPISPTDASAVVLRQKVHAILGAAELGNFSLAASQLPPLNAFVPLGLLQERADLTGRANLLLGDSPPSVSWQLSGFSWRAWARQQLYRLKLGRPWSPFHTNELPDDVALARLNQLLRNNLELADWQLQLNMVRDRAEMELRTPRVFLDSTTVDAAMKAGRARATNSITSPPYSYGVLTYLANLIRHGDQTTPYSMVTAAGSPLVPADLKDDEILISQWLADDLQAGPGDEIDLSYFAPDQASQLAERTNRFRVKAVLRMNDPALDRSLMPDFPGIAHAERAGDWQTGFPLTYKIREKDDAYWKQYRGTPKALISLAAGQRIWGNRFGNLTAVRYPLPSDNSEQFWYLEQNALEKALREALSGSAAVSAAPGQASPGIVGIGGRPPWDQPSSPAALNSATAVGLVPQPASSIFHFEPVRAQALAASVPTQDFGGLFLGLSFFVILAALILMALLFQFGIEQRVMEVGTLLALGFRPGQVRRLLLCEGTLLALLGGILGTLGGVFYARAMIHALTTLWSAAVGMASLHFHATAVTLITGLGSSVVVSAVTIWIVLRQQARQPARVLLAGGGSEGEKPKTEGRKKNGRWARWIFGLGCLTGVGLIGWAITQPGGNSAELFFAAGSLLLVGLLGGASLLFTVLDRAEASRKLSLFALGLRGCTRRRTRSLASVALLACGSFLIVAVGANRLDAGRGATQRSSGTGGFTWIGESTLPVVRDLNSKAGRELYNLDDAIMRNLGIVPLRVRDGDDASCLNLNRARVPRLLGVNPELLAQRRAFTFAGVEKGANAGLGWNLLRAGRPAKRPEGGAAGAVDEIPAIGDAASIEWALGKKLGDTIAYTDESGRPFKVRLVAGVANSILQGNLIIDEAEFVKRFPGTAGHRMFLIDAPSKDGSVDATVARGLTRGLRDVGLELVPATRRLAEFNAVQNTYLNTFQVLGAIGLLLGSAGLGVVVLRNVLERRGELGLLQAIGFRRRSLRWLILSEHAGLLGLGLGAGIVAALGAVAPVLSAPGAEIHQAALGVTLAGVLVSGLIWTGCATWFALRGRLLEALHDE